MQKKRDPLVRSLPSPRKTGLQHAEHNSNPPLKEHGQFIIYHQIFD